MKRTGRAQKVNTEVRQEQIAEAALDVVAVHGMKGLSVAAVADRVGLVPSAIYRHYRSKGALLDTVLKLIGDRLQANVTIVCEETADPLDRLQRLVARHVKLIEENRAIPSVVFSDEVYGGSSERREKVSGSIGRYLAQIERLVREGQTQGRIRPTLRPRTVAVMILGIIQPAAILAHLSGGEFDLIRHGREAWDLLRSALEAD